MASCLLEFLHNLSFKAQIELETLLDSFKYDGDLRLIFVNKVCNNHLINT